MILESIKTVLKVFKTNKMRTFLTMLGMIIGIFSITIILSLSDSTKKTMSESINSMSQESISLSLYADENIKNKISETELNNYLKSNNIKYDVSTSYDSVSVFNILYSKTENENFWMPLFLGINENYLETRNIRENILYGRNLNRKDIINKMNYILLREDLAEIIYGKSEVVGEILNVDNHEFKIIGILKNDINSYSDVGAYFSYYYAKDYMNTYGNEYQIYSTTNISKVQKEIKDILNENLSSDEYYIYTEDLEEMMDSMNNMVDIIEQVFAGIAGLSIIVGGIGIMNIMLVSVSERIKETGIRMALGAKNKDIIIQFLIEGIMITVLSGIIGIIIAFISTNIVNIIISNYEYNFKLVINFITMLKIIFFCGIIGIIFGIYPAVKAGKLDPVEALKYE